MASVLILGYGNTLRGDDGVGWRAAEQLLSSDLPSGISVKTLHQLAPELAPEIAAADYVLFVDATRDGGVGEVRVREVNAPVSDAGFTHQFTPASLLRMTNEVYGAAPVAYEISLCGESYDLADEFTPAIAEAFPRFVDKVRAFADELASSHK